MIDENFIEETDAVLVTDNKDTTDEVLCNDEEKMHESCTTKNTTDESTKRFTDRDYDDIKALVTIVETNSAMENVEGKNDNLATTWRKEVKRDEYGFAAKRMSYISRMTQLHKEIEKAIEVNDNPVLGKM